PALNPTMSAITNAIYNATGIRIKELPVSPEKLLEEINKKRET
ncbi:MAG: xanthine dehydrogenase family protein molybdopterin-binding subunit, partial [bacterium]|nr:xanthine dehydrogenase family protein molybdopterin-binding subunit [bacterium]